MQRKDPANLVSRRDAVRMLAGVVAAAPFVKVGRAGASPTAAAPNIVFIMTDDQRQDALSAYGNTILRTPNIDRIAAGGVRFTEAFVTNSLCAPSRASYLTGLYSHRHGVLSNGGGPQFYNQPGLRDEEITFPELLKAAGYHTGVIGKWHLRSAPTGFDSSVVFGRTRGGYYDPEMEVNGVRVKFRGHADDVVGDQALTFLRERPADKPFCLLYHFTSPHRAWMPAERFARAFEDIDVPVPRTFEDRLVGKDAVRRAEMAIADMPDFRSRGVDPSLPFEERKRLNLQHLVKNYYRVLLSVDENVGKFLDALDSAGLAENTIIVYTSDNGFFLGEFGLFDKRLMYEPSIKVPLLVRYPARVAPRVDRSHMILNVDAAPTLLELTGVPVPKAMQGRSFAPLLLGESVPWREDFLCEFFEYPAEHCARKHRGLRTKRWKLIHLYEQPEQWELYDLESDPDETRNLAGQRRYASVQRELRDRMVQLRRELGDVDPPGPAPVSLPCGNGVNTGYAPPE
jgi:arylsulfatase A-like enzyme